MAFLRLATVALCLISIAFAGCTSGSPDKDVTPTSNAPTPIVDEDSGAIQGTVIDDELLAIQDADVALTELALVAKTDDAGAFTFNELSPGDYTLFVTKLGYGSEGIKVSVAAGEITPAKVTLVALAVDEPRYESIPFSGQFQCSIAAVDRLWQDCGVETKSYFYFEKPTGVRHIVGELKWTSASAGTGQNLDFNLVKGTKVEDTESSQWYANVFGPSPLRLKVTVGQMFENPDSSAAVGSDDFDRVVDDEDKTLGFNIYSSPTYVQDQALIGVTLEQKFNGYVTLFYDMDVPEDFSAFPDA